MGWLTGKPNEPRKPVECNQCQGKGTVPAIGLAPGGRIVQVGRDQCPGCNGRGTQATAVNGAKQARSNGNSFRPGPR